MRVRRFHNTNNPLLLGPIDLATPESKQMNDTRARTGVILMSCYKGKYCLCCGNACVYAQKRFCLDVPTVINFARFYTARRTGPQL